MEFLLFAFVLDNDQWLVVWARFDLEWPELDVVLNVLVLILSSNEPLGIEDSVYWISGGLVLGSVTDESLLVVESDVRWSGVKTLIIWNDLDSVILPDSYA